MVIHLELLCPVPIGMLMSVDPILHFAVSGLVLLETSKCQATQVCGFPPKRVHYGHYHAYGQ